MLVKVKSVFEKFKDNLFVKYSIKKTVLLFLIPQWIIGGILLLYMLLQFANSKNELVVSLLAHSIMPAYLTYLAFINFILIKKSMKLENKNLRILGIICFGIFFSYFVLTLLLSLIGY